MRPDVYVTVNQKEHLAAALTLTGAHAFAEDACAVAAYRDGGEGQASKLVLVLVFDGFRKGWADVHFGLAPDVALTPEMVQAISQMAFHKRVFGLDRIACRVPVENRELLARLIEEGFEIEYRDRASTATGGDAIVLSLGRDATERASAAPQPEMQP